MNARILRCVALFPILFACGGSASPANDAAVAKAKKQSPIGAKVYKKECAGCHGSQGQGLGGTPEVMGPTALPMKGVGGDTGPFENAQDVFDYLQRAMPLPKSKIGSLSDEEYWAVVEYMLVGAKRKVPPGLNGDNASDVVVNK